MKCTFREEQRFNQWWIWLIIVTVGFMSFIMFYNQAVNQKYIGFSSTNMFKFILFLFLFIAFSALFFYIRLETFIDERTVKMYFFPFVRKNVNWTDIKYAEVVNYGFVGGWGIRLWTKYGTVYNIRGNKGLAIELNNGKKFLIGTQKEEKLKKTLSNLSIAKNR